MVDKLALIKQTVEKVKSLPNGKIEYNLGELPKHPEVKVDSFFGIEAIYSKDRDLNTLNVIYKFG